MRIWRDLAGRGGQLHGLVHPAVAADDRLGARHLWFIGTRLVIGCLGLAVVPVALAAHGSLSPLLLGVVALLALQAGIALWVSRTGVIEAPLHLSVLTLCAALAMAGLGLGGHVDGLGLLAVVTVEAAIVGGSRGLAVAAVSSLLTQAASAAAMTGVAPLVGFGPHLVLLGAAVGVGVYLVRQLEARETRDLEVAVQRKMILDGLGDLVTLHDDQGAVVFAGDSSHAVLGVSPTSLTGRGLFERVHVADRPGFLTALCEAASSDRLIHAQLRLRTGDLDRLHPPVFAWFELRARSFPVAAGGAPEVLCLLRDVSIQKERSEALETARREADLANALKSRFLAMVSHELRTPLNAIIGFSEILASDTLTPADPERRREYARIVNTSGQHLLGVVNTLLDISQIEAGTFPLDPEPVSMAEVAIGVTDMLRLKADEAGVAIACDLPPDLPMIVADRRACRQILLNLVSNAVKFTPRGGQVEVSAARALDGLSLIVRDTGVGIAAEDLPRVGEPFFQVRSGHDRPFEGTGLGLSVVRGLVALHGGTLVIDSAPGVGTVVTVRLPESAPVPRTHSPVVIAPSFSSARPDLPAGSAPSQPPVPDSPRVKKRA